MQIKVVYNIFSKIRKFDDSLVNLVKKNSTYILIVENKKKHYIFFVQQIQSDNILPTKILGNILSNGISCRFIEIYPGYGLFSSKSYSTLLGRQH